MRWLILAAVGALLCTVGDHLHAVSGILDYAHVFAWDQAWWVPLLFACATLSCVSGAAPFLTRGAPMRTPDIRQISADGIGFLAAYAYTSFAPAERPNVTLLVLATAFLVRVMAERRAPMLVVYCLFLSAAGAVFEGTLSLTGAFAYRHPDFYGVPRWLPGIYLHAGLIAGELSLFMGISRTGP